MTSTDKVQGIVLCEGFEDRSFWRGWLLHLGCTDPTQGGKYKAKDVHGSIIAGKGRFLFKTVDGSDVIVQPFHGKDNARRAVDEYLSPQRIHKPAQVVLNLDSDQPTPDDDSFSTEDKIYRIAQDYGWDGDRSGPFVLNGVVLTSVVWRCDDPVETVGVPQMQTLERLVTSAIRASDPEMGGAVESFLSSAPDGLKLPKSYSYSYFAKWFSDHGDAHFYEWIWNRPEIAKELTQRLRASGAWATVEALLKR